MNRKLRWFFAASLVVGILIVALLPPVVGYWVPVLIRAGFPISAGAHLDLLIALSVAWIVIAAIGLVSYGRRGLWLLLGAPLGLLPILAYLWLFFGCIFFGQCL